MFTRGTFNAWFRLENPDGKPAEITLSRWSFIWMTYENICKSDAPINSSHNYKSLEMREKRSVRQARVQDFSRADAFSGSPLHRQVDVLRGFIWPFRSRFKHFCTPTNASNKSSRGSMTFIWRLSGIPRQSDVARQRDARCRYDTRFIFGIFR
jgi:hypothetical protein